MRSSHFVLLFALAAACAACGDTSDPQTPSLPDAGDGGPDGGLADGGDASMPPPACEPPDTLPEECNGSATLCDKRFNEVAYATTHNAYSVAGEFLASNQTYGIARQLEDGIRGFMLDSYVFEDDVYLCHGGCGSILGRTLLYDTLVTMREFLRCHPTEVITIIFESYVSAARTLEVFEASGILDYAHAQPLDEPWPTLAEMIAADRRLVVLTDKDGGAYDWYHDVWDYARETPYEAKEPEDLRCTGGRGPLDAGLLIFNHFLTKGVGSTTLADMVNHDPYLSERIEACEEELGQQANFITVDFYEIGDVIAATAAQNGL